LGHPKKVQKHVWPTLWGPFKYNTPSSLAAKPGRGPAKQVSRGTFTYKTVQLLSYDQAVITKTRLARSGFNTVEVGRQGDGLVG